MYVWVENDKEQQRTLRGNTALSAQINYGSRSNSKKAVNVNINWEIDAEEPTVYISIGKGLKYNVSESLKS